MKTSTIRVKVGKLPLTGHVPILPDGMVLTLPDGTTLKELSGSGGTWSVDTLVRYAIDLKVRAHVTGPVKRILDATKSFIVDLIVSGKMDDPDVQAFMAVKGTDGEGDVLMDIHERRIAH